MFDYLKKILSADASATVSGEESSYEQTNHIKQLQIATAALFVEMAKADGEFSVEERDRIIQSLKAKFNLDDVYVVELIELSRAELHESVSLYEFSNVINERFSIDDKYELLKNLWRLIYTDKKLDKYEDRLIKIIGGMLKMEHKQVIDAKMIVRAELNLN